MVFFDRIGQKVLLTEPNYRYRAITTDAAERRAVDDSFARSVLWGFKVEAEDAGRVLVDATAFFMRDAHGVAERLRKSEQGRYRLDEARSALYLPRTKGFPKNTEVEATLTFTTDEEPGRYVRQTTPSPQAVTLREHHSFVELPDAHYKPRKLDPRAASFGVEFYDYASPITEPVEKRWISRHRLEKKDPAAALSDPVAADRLLRRQRRAGADPQRAHRRRVVVEPGVRGGRIPQRVPGEGAARRRRPDGRSLQHDQLGAPLDARLVVRRRHHRSAHRRDHQGQRHARLAARPAGLHCSDSG